MKFKFAAVMVLMLALAVTSQAFAEEKGKGVGLELIKKYRQLDAARAGAEKSASHLAYDMAAVDPNYNMIGTFTNLDQYVDFIWSYDYTHDTIMAIVVDKYYGDLSYYVGYPYLLFDIYPSYTDVYGAVPGGGWNYMGYLTDIPGWYY